MSQQEQPADCGSCISVPVYMRCCHCCFADVIFSYMFTIIKKQQRALAHTHTYTQIHIYIHVVGCRQYTFVRASYVINNSGYME